MSLDWFFKLPGLFITGGVVLILIALLVFILGSKGEKGKKSKNKDITPTATSPTVDNTPVEPISIEPAPAVTVEPISIEPTPAVSVEPVSVEPTPAVTVEPVNVEPAPAVSVETTLPGNGSIEVQQNVGNVEEI